MDNLDRKTHWDAIYQKKNPNEVSWYQPTPTTSLDFVKQFDVPKNAKIIDIGGGDSLFVDHLLDLGYQDVTVLDISASSLDKAKQRLGERAAKVKWIVADAATFKPTEKYDFWHDRAAFHFLTQEQEIEHYLRAVQQGIKPAGVLVIGAFSERGPSKCSGIDIRQYSEVSMAERLKSFFEKIRCITVDHRTPFNTIQNFVFCSFRKLQLF
ncbi:class I SAM-dependent methyltransferase [Pontibacter pamirensis]|uniref:class I SAM-dependent methyltransferase n=1 Tax=Pontibacter pamirensis TaxID=2562824 RepID=UPI001389D7DE|nr:class I SAM-dependent methyltransferase [Pontibacter pamirensis]